MFNPKFTFLLVILVSVSALGCIKTSDKRKTALVLQAQNADQSDLERQIDYLAGVSSMRAKMYLKFEDNTSASSGSNEVYKQADGDIIVQRPANIRLKVEVPVLGTDVAAMTSDGKSFRVAILQDGGDGSNKKFIVGTNEADYSALQKQVDQIVEEKKPKKKVGESAKAFANLRPQHFTDALLVAPIDRTKYVYTMSPFQQEEIDFQLYKKKDPLGWVLRSYYFFDEYETDGSNLKLRRRFWFDRAGGALLSRQQIFGKDGEIESDIIYGKRGLVSKDNQYNLPLEIKVTRPKEKYAMRFLHADENGVKIGREYPATAFMLENEWELPELDLDQELKRNKAGDASALTQFFE